MIPGGTTAEFREEPLPKLEGEVKAEIPIGVSLGHSIMVVVTSSGKLLASGTTLKNFIMDDAPAGFTQVPLPENHKCERAWVV